MAARTSIDRDVRRVLSDALAVYDVDSSGLAAAEPDVVLTQDLCDVCAVSVKDVQLALAEIAGAGGWPLAGASTASEADSIRRSHSCCC